MLCIVMLRCMLRMYVHTSQVQCSIEHVAKRVAWTNYIIKLSYQQPKLHNTE